MVSLAMKRPSETNGANGNGPDDRRRRLRSRNIAVAATLGVLVVLFYIVAIIKMSGG